MTAYLLGLVTIPALFGLGALALWGWKETFWRSVGANGCWACEQINPPHPFPSWEVGSEPNWRWHWECLRHRWAIGRRDDHRAAMATWRSEWHR